MPSALPQLNVRVQPAVVERLARLQSALAADRGHPVSQADAISYAISRAAKAAGKNPKENQKKT